MNKMFLKVKSLNINERLIIFTVQPQLVIIKISINNRNTT